MYKLLVVDSESGRKALEAAVDWKALGFSSISGTESGGAAILIARERKPDLIITELRLPGLDGIRMIRRLRGEGFRCQILILSESEDFFAAKEAIELNIAAYLLKPVNSRDLTERITRLFAKPEPEIPDMTAPALMDEVLRFIGSHYHRPIHLNTVAELHHYSPTYLGRVFKQVTGQTFRHYLERVRMERAKELLCKGHKVYVVAGMVGYTSVDYFADKFKAHTGATPNEYKKVLCPRQENAK